MFMFMHFELQCANDLCLKSGKRGENSVLSLVCCSDKLASNQMKAAAFFVFLQGLKASSCGGFRGDQVKSDRTYSGVFPSLAQRPT